MRAPIRTQALHVDFGAYPLTEGYSYVFGGVSARAPVSYDRNVGSITGSVVAPANQLPAPVSVPDAATSIELLCASLGALLTMRRVMSDRMSRAA